MTAEKKKKVLRIPIGFKVVSMTAVMLAAAVLIVVLVATRLFKEETEGNLEDNARSFASQLASQTNGYISSLVGVVTAMTEIQTAKIDLKLRDFNLLQHFTRNDEILAVGTWTKGENTAKYVSYNDPKSEIKDFFSSLKPSDEAWGGQADLQRVTYNSQGYLVLSFPISIGADKKVLGSAFALLKPSKLAKIYEAGSSFTNYLVDRKGVVLAHPNDSVLKMSADYSTVPIVKDMITSGANTRLMRFDDKEGVSQIGAYKVVGIAGTGVVAQIPSEKVYELVTTVKRRSAMVAGMMIFLSFGVAFFFSKTLTKPIKYLVALTREIAGGNFNIVVKPKGHDEITELTSSFGKMATGLAEREKLKETFKKFHSPEIAEAILKGEIKLGGDRQEATVFFSDIRSFTSMSEDMNAEGVVEMLNEYMTEMVSEITKHHGVVDKYVGDAIMAVWGVPLSKGNDAWNAVRASIAMRQRLAVFNEGRIKNGKKPIMIGMGLHCGELIAGNIGSIEKMEYTVIGDTVNTASRIESLTKEFGTDMLISEAVYEKTKDKLLVEPVEAMVKGKAKALTAYKVKGFIDESGNKVIVETPYSTYEAGHSDKVVHKESA